VLELTRRVNASLVLTLGALLGEVPHTRPVRLSGGAYDPEIEARLGVKPTRYEGPTGIVGVLYTACREQSIPTASLWANVPHYISGIENPKAALALVRRVLSLLNAEADLADLTEAASQFEQNLNGIVSQNAKIAEYVAKLEKKKPDEDETEDVEDTPRDELPPSSELVAEFEQFLRQQRPENT
jgi:predicted ATP-grasp superfamily ATP-dependent carboligase